MLAAVCGVVCGAAGRTLFVLGFYDVAGALAISAGAVFLHHLLRAQPGRRSRWLVAGLAALAWLGALRASDAAAFRLEQVRAVDSDAPILTHEFAAAGAESAAQFVDLGLEAETGRRGVAAAAIVQLRAGLAVLRTPGQERRLPVRPLWHALFWGAEAAFVAVVVARGLAELARAPRCAVCGRYLRRRRWGDLTATAAHQLAAAWERGERPSPGAAAGVGSQGPEGLALFEDACPVAGHTAAAGWAIVRGRRRGLGTRAPGEVARCEATTAP